MNDEYFGFFELVAGHVAAALANSKPTRKSVRELKPWPNWIELKRHSFRMSAMNFEPVNAHAGARSRVTCQGA